MRRLPDSLQAMDGNASRAGPDLSRRALLAGAAALPIASGVAASGVAAQAGPPASTAAPGEGLARAMFAPMPTVHLDSGTAHPVPLGARDAVQRYLHSRATGERWPSGEVERRVKERFARLVGASPRELAFVQSTTAGEQLAIDALDLPGRGGRIVTDTLHFFGSFWIYEQLARRGMEVVWLRPEDGRIDPAAYERAIDGDTRLVSLSLVSTYNGFEHDLARICDAAHAHGARVYADIIHTAGTVPLDLHATGVDFAACASYKWLMGDFGLGFLYVREGLLDQLRRPRFGYYQLARFRSHVYPFDPPGDGVADMAARDDAEGLFAMGTRSHAVMAQLDWTLAALLELGVERIAQARMPLLARLHEALPAKGYRVVTPPDSRTPLLTCALEGARERLAPALERAGVTITLSRNRFRVCPSFFNTIDDVERLIDALPRLPQEDIR